MLILQPLTTSKRRRYRLDCGYGRGFSVLQVIEAVKRVSGVDFPVRRGPRRPGDPAVLIAGAKRIKEMLGWRPELNNLDTIVTHALNWEQKSEPA